MQKMSEKVQKTLITRKEKDNCRQNAKKEQKIEEVEKEKDM